MHGCAPVRGPFLPPLTFCVRPIAASVACFAVSWTSLSRKTSLVAGGWFALALTLGGFPVPPCPFVSGRSQRLLFWSRVPLGWCRGVSVNPLDPFFLGSPGDVVSVSDLVLFLWVLCRGLVFLGGLFFFVFSFFFIFPFFLPFFFLDASSPSPSFFYGKSASKQFPFPSAHCTSQSRRIVPLPERHASLSPLLLVDPPFFPSSPLLYFNLLSFLRNPPDPSCLFFDRDISSWCRNLIREIRGLF